MMASLFSFFTRNFFICERNIIWIIDRIIARVKSICIMFHNVIYIVTFHMICETVSIDIHNFAFVAKQQYSWWKSYKDVFRYIEDAHIYVYQFVEFHTSFLSRPNSPKRRYNYENSISRSLSLHRISHSNALKVARRRSCAHSLWFCRKLRH